MGQEKLINAAAALAQAAPQRWEEFLIALELFTVEATNNFIASDTASLQINQGRVQAYRLMHLTCSTAVKQQKEIMERKRG